MSIPLSRGTISLGDKVHAPATTPEKGELKRGEASLFIFFPLSFKGEGDKAGSQENRRFFWVLKGGEVDNQ